MDSPIQPNEKQAYCCAMRRHFVIGILGEVKGDPLPPDTVDFAIEFHPRVVLAIRFCPFCGTRMDHKQALRNV